MTQLAKTFQELETLSADAQELVAELISMLHRQEQAPAAMPSTKRDTNLDRFFGSVNSGAPTSGDNRGIDEDLAH